MESQIVVDFLEILGRDFQRGPVLGIKLILEGHHSIQPVVAAGELNNYEDGVLGDALSQQRSSGRRAGDEPRSGQSPGNQTTRGRRLEKFASVEHRFSPLYLVLCALKLQRNEKVPAKDKAQKTNPIETPAALA